jgi:hypothetical protein
MQNWIKGIARLLFGNDSKDPGKTRPMMEPLEGRELLSAAAQDCAMIGHCTMVVESEPAIDYQQVIHKYKGTIQTTLRPRPFNGMINIKSINPDTGRVTGLVSIPFLVDNFKFALKGVVRPEGTYTFTFKRPGVSARLDGSYTPKQHLVGNFSAKGPPGSVTGTMDFHKI